MPLDLKTEFREYATRVGRGENRRSSQNSNSRVKDDKPRTENPKTNTSREAGERGPGAISRRSVVCVKISVRPLCKPTRQNPRMAFMAEASAAWQKPQEDRTGRFKSITNFSRRAQESGFRTDLGVRGLTPSNPPSGGQTCGSDNVRAEVA